MRKFVQISVIILFLILFSGRFATAFAQSFKMQLENSGSAINVGDSFNVNILIDTGGQEAINGDVLLTYDPAMVAIDSGSSDNFFTYHSSTPLSGSSDKYLASSWEESVAHAKTASADTPFYTLNLTARAAGATVLSFDCVNGSEADTNINRSSDSADIVICPLTPLNINIGGQGSLSPTPGDGTPSPTLAPTVTPTLEPTATPSPTNTPPVSQTTVTELPRAGVIENTVMFLGLGTLLTVVGFLLIL